ncbi:MAG TPA: hypothetical protein VKS80_15060, partial [Trinickia sp.]|nr:hypothetical protein [Trinickia sp.]
AAIENAPEVDRFAAHNALGQTHLFKGEPALALPHIAAVLEGYSAARHADLAAHYGEDPGVVCHYYAALTAWLIGDAAKARDMRTAVALIDAALRESEETGERWYLPALRRLKGEWLAKESGAACK